MTERSPSEFVFSEILRASGIDPESPESLFFVDLDDLNLEGITTVDLVTAVAEVVHDNQEHAFMDSGWIFKESALIISEQFLVRQREIQLASGIQLALESIEDFGKLPAEALQRAHRDPIEVN